MSRGQEASLELVLIQSDQAMPPHDVQRAIELVVGWIVSSFTPTPEDALVPDGNTPMRMEDAKV